MLYGFTSPYSPPSGRLSHLGYFPGLYFLGGFPGEDTDEDGSGSDFCLKSFRRAEKDLKEAPIVILATTVDEQDIGQDFLSAKGFTASERGCEKTQEEETVVTTWHRKVSFFSELLKIYGITEIVEFDRGGYFRQYSTIRVQDTAKVTTENGDIHPFGYTHGAWISLEGCEEVEAPTDTVKW